MAGLTIVPANPTLGKFVMMSPFSGPKGSPFDKDQAGNFSTGALSTGIGFGANKVTNVSTGTVFATPVQAIKNAGFTDDYTPGVSLPAVTVAFPTGLAPDARLTAIGGGRNVITGGGATGLGISTPSPYAVQPLLGWGNGASRDGGAGPAFTGFATKMVTAAGAVAIGAVIETGFTNRSDQVMVLNDSAFGSATAASAAIT